MLQIEILKKVGFLFQQMNSERQNEPLKKMIITMDLAAIAFHLVPVISSKTDKTTHFYILAVFFFFIRQQEFDERGSLKVTPSGRPKAEKMEVMSRSSPF